MDRVAAELEQPRQRVAVGRVAGVADVDRTGRVGADELDVDDPRGVGAAAAERLAGIQDARQRLRVPAVGQEEVEEPRACNLDAVERRAEATSRGGAPRAGASSSAAFVA
jgi:hypothetical protein